MNKSFLSKNRINLDMTALLDVIFIILMVVLCNTKTQINDITNKLDDATGTINTSDNQLDNFEHLEKYVSVVSVYADYDSMDPTLRHIRYTLNTNEDVYVVDIKPGTEDSAYEEFIASINGFILERADKQPVLINIDTSQILHRDYVRIEKEISLLKSQYGNLYVNEKNMYEDTGLEEVTEDPADNI